jgi:hypothetical protein
MQELEQLLNDSGMSDRDFCYALSQMSQQRGGTRLRLKSFEEMLNGERPTPAGIISDAYQVCENQRFVEAHVAAHPELQKLCSTYFVYALDIRK